MIRNIWLAALVVVLSWSTSSWAQIGGGGGFGGGGIHVDANGVLRPGGGKQSAKVIVDSKLPAELDRAGYRQVSLSQLDRQLRELVEAKKPIPAEMQFLAGLVKVELVRVDPAAKDVYLVGPAEGWRVTTDGRPIGKQSLRPVLHLVDLLAALRCVLGGQGEVYCSIDPTAGGLASAGRFIENLPVPDNRRDGDALRQKLVDQFDLQTIETRGVPAGSRFSLVMIEADYRMKRMAIGIEGFPGVHSHLDTLVGLTEKGNWRPNLARWWFAPSYDAVVRDEDGTLFQFRGQGIMLLNEEVLVDRDGGRRGSGGHSPDWDRFAQSFSKQLGNLERKHPVFADLHNLFDLMMVAGLIRQQGWSEWFERSALLDEDVFAIPTQDAPRHAEPIVTYKLHTGRENGKRMHYISMAYGGVSMRPESVLAHQPIQIDSTVAPMIASSEAAAGTALAAPASKDANGPTPAWWAELTAPAQKSGSTPSSN